MAGPVEALDETATQYTTAYILQPHLSHHSLETLVHQGLLGLQFSKIWGKKICFLS